MIDSIAPSFELSRDSCRTSTAGSGVKNMRNAFLPFVLVLPAALLLLRCQDKEVRGASDAPPIEIKATVQPAQSMTVVAQVDGQVQSVAVREGAKIAANQEVAQLTNPSVERDAALARAQLEWLESRRNTPPRAEPARPRDRRSWLSMASPWTRCGAASSADHR